MDNVHVSVADILEVRDEDGFYPEELLALIVSACDALNNRGNKKGVFSSDYIYITSSGNVEIALVSATLVPEEFLPPEIRSYYAETDNVEDEISDPQLVWCLGEVVRQACSPNCSDAGLFSLINLMTVEHVGTRPTISKLAQMVKNKINDTDSVRKLLMVVYQEIMGDLDDLAADEVLDDEYRLSRRASAAKIRSSLLLRQQQGIPGLISPPETTEEHHGKAPTHITDFPKVNGAKKLARATSSNSSDFGQETESENEEDYLPVKSNQDEPDFGLRIPNTLQPIEEGSPYEIHKIATRTASSSGSSTVVRSASLSLISEKPEEFEEETSKKSSISNGFGRNPFEEHVEQNPFDESVGPNPFEIEDRLEKLDFEEEVIERTPTRERTPSPLQEQHEVFPLIIPKREAKLKEKTPPRTPPRTSITEASFQHEIKETSKNMPVEEIVFEEPSPKVSVSARQRYEPAMPSTSKKSPAPPPPSAATIMPKVEATTLPRVSKPIEEPQHFSRQNSLQPSKVRRSTARKPRKAIAVPEFVEKRSSSLIRLQAQSAKKKRVTLYRVEDSCVYIKVLNGQTIEVNCRTDAYVSNVFDTVVDHLNINEHNFFGLAIFRDDEYFFLENEQRLEKFAPPGWKNAKKAAPTAKSDYTLYLRFRYYPKRPEFVKTDTTLHELYLQLRLDTLASTLKPNRDKTFELGALALQAEYSDRRDNNAQYFQVDNYLPKRVYYNDDISRVQNILSELHTHYAGMKTMEAERAFIKICQAESGYGTHNYRVYKIKPSTHTNHSLNYTDSHWIGIMPNGIVLSKEQQGNLVTTASYEWGQIRTLQFDRKRFLIVTGDETQLNDHIFYTDHYSKSGYLVRFAAAQHRFMIKMRHWQSTLGRDMGRPEIGIDKTIQESEPVSLHHEIFETIDRTKREKARKDSIQAEQEIQPKISISENEHKGLRWTESGSSEAIRLNVQLEKDPAYGLGLTLVDGVVNGVKGVYVKSVSNQGDGRRKGLIIGDCLQSVNGVSLVEKTRHDAVNLVKESGPIVNLEILRFPLISEVLGSNELINGSESVIKSVPVIVHQPDTTAGRKSSTSTDDGKPHERTGRLGRPSTPPPLRTTRTPPPPRKPAAKNYKRAVSDFGAIGDTLPVLNSEDLLGTIGRNRSHYDSSDESDGEAKRGEYKVPVSSMYTFHASDDDEDKLDFELPQEDSEIKHPVEHYRRKDQVTISGNGKVSKSAMDTSLQRRQLDWTTELSDIDDGRSESDHSGNDVSEAGLTTHTVVINRIPGRSLGFQIASSGGNVYIKQINSEPALSANLKVDDRIVSINQRPTGGSSHQEVVEMLKAGGTSTVVLAVERRSTLLEPENTITVVLDKSMHTSLGLSLAKKMGHDGIFIRNISVGSVAENEGTLKVGDRIWEINDENVADESPTQIVDRFKKIEGSFTIVVKRPIRRD